MFFVNQPPYPTHAFPPSICRAAEELANAVQVTDVIAGTTCLTGLSIALSPLADWRHPQSGQIRPCTLYQALAAISGDRKSSAEATLCAPLQDHDIDAVELDAENEKAYGRAMSRWSAIHARALAYYAKQEELGNLQAAETRLSAIEAQKPAWPTTNRIVYTDVTKQSVIEALVGEGRAVALLTDEGQTLLSSTVMRHYGWLNSLWDGKPLVPLDRAGYRHLIARNPRLTISFMIQPDLLADFFAKRGKQVRDSGFCARFLFSRSQSIQGLRPPRLKLPLLHLLPFHERIRELLATYKLRLQSGRMTREVVELSDEAKVMWLQIAGKVEADFFPGQYLHDISDFGNKYMDTVGRIACLLHCFEARELVSQREAASQTGELGRISDETLARAEQIAAWHLNEYKQLFSPPLQRAPEELDADKVYSYLYRNHYAQGKVEALKNHVRQYSGIRNSNRLHSALQILASRQAIWITPVVYGNSKKATEVVNLNLPHFKAYPIY